MQDNIHGFYDEIISPFIRDFENDRADLKCAYGSAWALDSYASHIYHYFKQSAHLEDYGDIGYKKNVLFDLSIDFELINHVSAATKHSVRSNPSKTKIYSSADLSSEHLESYAAYFSGTDPDDWGQQIIITNDQHFFKPLLPIVLRAEAFLIRHCASLQPGI